MISPPWERDNRELGLPWLTAASPARPCCQAARVESRTPPCRRRARAARARRLRLIREKVLPGIDNRVVVAPAGASQLTFDFANPLGFASGDRHFPQLVVRPESEPLAVGRKERRSAALVANSPRLELARHAEYRPARSDHRGRWNAIHRPSGEIARRGVPHPSCGRSGRPTAAGW